MIVSYIQLSISRYLLCLSCFRFYSVFHPIMAHINVFQYTQKVREPKNSIVFRILSIFLVFPCVLVNCFKRPTIIPILLSLFTIYNVYEWYDRISTEPTIIVITPTHKTGMRLADMTRLSQTLMHIKNIHWIVVEDANHTVDAVERILKRSRIPYAYFNAVTEEGFPSKLRLLL